MPTDSFHPCMYAPLQCDFAAPPKMRRSLLLTSLNLTLANSKHNTSTGLKNAVPYDLPISCYLRPPFREVRLASLRMRPRGPGTQQPSTSCQMCEWGNVAARWLQTRTWSQVRSAGEPPAKPSPNCWPTKLWANRMTYFMPLNIGVFC